MKIEEITPQRLEELAQRAYERDYPVFSPFLNLSEISTLKGLKLPVSYTLFGGYNCFERAVAGFGNEVKNKDFPIVCICIEPLSKKFSDSLSHRDFLGSLMNLGISRSTLGDIAVKDNTGYLFCLESIADYITENLSRVKHTSVKCERIKDVPDFINALPESEEIIVTSLRADAVISSVYRLSRAEASRLFKDGKVFVNSKQLTKDSAALKENDIVSVRGHGKFIFDSTLRKTKKDREVISVRIYK